MKQKTIFTLAAITFLFINSFAQSPFRIGGSFNVIFPTGDYADLAKPGVGGTLAMNYSLMDEFAILFSSSYSNLSTNIPGIGVDGKAIDFSITSYNLLLGGRYNFNYSFFALAKSGVSYLKLYASIFDSPNNTVDGVSSDYEPYFTFLLGGGYRYNLAKGKSDLEFFATYNFIPGDIINFNTFVLKTTLMVYL